MKIEINLTKKEAKHLEHHTFFDDCSEVASIMEKIQRGVLKRKE